MAGYKQFLMVPYKQTHVTFTFTFTFTFSESKLSRREGVR